MSRTPYLDLNIPDKSSKGFVVTDVFEPNFTKLDQEAERLNLRKMSTEDNIEELKKSTRYSVGDIVEVLGYYEKGDGANHLRQKKPVGYTGTDAVIGNDGSIWGIVHNGEVNVSWFGAKPFDFSNTVSKKFDYSYRGISGSVIQDVYVINNDSYSPLQKSAQYIASTGAILKIDIDVYSSQNITFENCNSVTIESNDKKIINATFIFRNIKKTTIESISFENDVANVITPPKKPTDDTINFDTGNYFWYEKLYDIGFSTSAIQIDGDTNFESFIVKKCSAKNRDNFVNITATSFVSKNVKGLIVENCNTNGVWWHGVGTRNTIGAIIKGNNFNTHWVGLGVDFSRNTSESIFANNSIYKTSAMAKCQSGESVYLSENNTVANNVYTSPDFNENYYDPLYCVYNYGENNSFYDNNIVLNKNMDSVFKNAYSGYFSNNKITINSGQSSIFTIYKNNTLGRFNFYAKNNIVIGGSTVNFVKIGVDSRVGYADVSNNSLNGVIMDNFIVGESETNTNLTVEGNKCICNKDFFTGVFSNKVKITENEVSCKKFVQLNSDSSATDVELNKNRVYFDNVSTDNIFARFTGRTISNIDIKNNSIKGNLGTLFYAYDLANNSPCFGGRLSILNNDCLRINANSTNFIYLAGYANSIINVDGNFLELSNKISGGGILFNSSKHLGSAYWGQNNTFIGLDSVSKSNLATKGFISASITSLDTPYHATQMSKLGILDSYHNYLTELHEYESQNIQSDTSVMNLNVIQPPIIPTKVEEYAKEYNLI